MSPVAAGRSLTFHSGLEGIRFTVVISITFLAPGRLLCMTERSDGVRLLLIAALTQQQIGQLFAASSIIPINGYHKNIEKQYAID